MGKEPCSLRARRKVSRPVKPGHAHVGNHHVDLLLAQDFQGALAGGDGHGVETLAGQEGIQQAALARVVIHDEEARAWCGLEVSGGTMFNPCS